MPIVGSFASLSKSGFNGGNSAGGVNPPPSPLTNYWFSVVDLKTNSTGTFGSIKQINSNVWMFGYGGGLSLLSYRPYAVTFSLSTGLVNYYKVFADIPALGAAYTKILDVEQDSSSNTYYLTDNAVRLFKYDSTDTFAIGNIYSGSTGTIGGPYNIVKDSLSYLYILSGGATYYTITKIDPSTLTSIWSYQITITNSSSKLYIDSLDNLYVTTWTSTGTVNTIVKFDTSGTILWQKSTTAFSSSLLNRFDFDSTGNIYILGNGTPGILVKLNSSGTVQYSKSIPVISGGNYIGLTVNAYDNIVLQSLETAGVYIWTYTVTLTSAGVGSSARQTGTYTGGAGDDFNTSDIISDINLYMSGSMVGGRPPKIALQLAPDDDVSVGGSFNFTITSDNGSTNSYSGTIRSTVKSVPSITSTTVTFSTTSYTTSAFSITTTSDTPSLGSTVPYSYAISI